jgi:hypothetical protein
MKLSRSLMVLAIGFGLCGEACAEGTDAAWWHAIWRSLRKPCPCCPDDYCGKPLPGACRVTCFGADDYHEKPLPGVKPLRYCTPDDYCPKRYGFFLPPCSPSWYTCDKGRCQEPGGSKVTPAPFMPPAP